MTRAPKFELIYVPHHIVLGGRGALDSLREGAEPLGLRFSWIKTTIQALGDILDAIVESIPVNGENVDVTQTFTYLGSVIHSSTSC